MTTTTITAAERRHNAAQAIATARAHLIRAATELDGIESQDALHFTRLSITTCDDARAHLSSTEARLNPPAFGSEVLTRLDDNPSDYEDEV